MNFDTISVQEAVKRSIQTEKNAMDFYKMGASKMRDPEARRIFSLLAEEERGHAGSFYNIYTGSDIPSLEAFLDKAPHHESEWLVALNKLIDAEFNEQKAMELAMHKERQLEDVLARMAEKIDNAEVKAVFLQNIKETHNHYLMIESEYARLMGMVHESDMDTYVRE